MNNNRENWFDWFLGIMALILVMAWAISMDRIW